MKFSYFHVCLLCSVLLSYAPMHQSFRPLIYVRVTHLTQLPFAQGTANDARELLHVFGCTILTRSESLLNLEIPGKLDKLFNFGEIQGKLGKFLVQKYQTRIYYHNIIAKWSIHGKWSSI